MPINKENKSQDKRVTQKEFTNKNLGYKFERKRIKKDKRLPPICKDYKPTDNFGMCELSDICKNATYSFSKNDKYGHCYGGTKESELDFRQMHLLNEKKLMMLNNDGGFSDQEKGLRF